MKSSRSATRICTSTTCDDCNHYNLWTKDSCTKRQGFQRASTNILDKANHLTAFCARDSSPPSPGHPSVADEGWYCMAEMHPVQGVVSFYIFRPCWKNGSGQLPMPFLFKYTGMLAHCYFAWHHWRLCSTLCASDLLAKWTLIGQL